MIEIQKKNVIIITYHMIPHTRIWGACQRMYYLAEYLLKQRVSVTIIHSSFGVHYNYNKETNFKAIPIKIYFRFLQKLQNSFQREIHTYKVQKHNYSSKLIRIFKDLVKKIEKNVFNDFNPFGFLIWIWTLSVKKELKKNMHQYNNSTFILSGPYFTYFNLSTFIKREIPSSKIILDYRDPWNLLKKGSKYTFYKEKKYLRNADIIIFFSEKFMNSMITTFNISSKKCHFVYNGYDSDLWDEINNMSKFHKNVEKLIISYVASGITFREKSGRDPNNFLNALARFNAEDKIIVNIIGCSDFPKDELTDKIEINFYPILSQKEANIFLNNSDVSVILHSDLQPSIYTLTGKLFDCIRSRTYILGISNNLNVHYCQLIEDLQVGSVCKNDVQEIYSEISKIYYKWQNNTITKSNNKDISVYSRNYQNEIFWKIIQKLDNN